jgi:bifunctional ADP-heptose synthase (sugar kinase/adenylyltransferase)
MCPGITGEAKTFHAGEVSQLSHIVHLADRVAVSINRDQNVIDQIEGIRKKISGQKNTAFMPELVEAFMDVSVNEYIWLDTVYKPLLYILPNIVLFDTVELDLDGINQHKIIANIMISKKSRLPATIRPALRKRRKNWPSLWAFRKTNAR